MEMPSRAPLAEAAGAGEGQQLIDAQPLDDDLVSLPQRIALDGATLDANDGFQCHGIAPCCKIGSRKQQLCLSILSTTL